VILLNCRKLIGNKFLMNRHQTITNGSDARQFIDVYSFAQQLPQKHNLSAFLPHRYWSPFWEIAWLHKSCFYWTPLLDRIFTMVLSRDYFEWEIFQKYIQKASICDQAQLSSSLQSWDILSTSKSCGGLLQKVLSPGCVFWAISDFYPWTFIIITLELIKLQQPA